MKQKIFITGAGGMLGDAVCRAFSERAHLHATDLVSAEPWIERLDITDHAAVRASLRKIEPDVIIHLAALTDLEQCEKNPDLAFAVNTHSVEELSTYAREHAIPLVYISTACIFEGSGKSYAEEDAPHPINTYGESKYRGELLARTVPQSIILRAAWMVGGGPSKDKKFFNKIMGQLQQGAKEILAVDDKRGSISYTYDIAATIAYLIDHKLGGVFHHVCDGEASRYDIAKFIVENLKLADRVRVRAVDSSYFQKAYFTPRLASEQLSNALLKGLAPSLIRPWQECLEEYLQKFDWLA